MFSSILGNNGVQVAVDSATAQAIGSSEVADLFSNLTASGRTDVRNPFKKKGKKKILR